jgi:hypothetical protein
MVKVISAISSLLFILLVIGGGMLLFSDPLCESLDMLPFCEEEETETTFADSVVLWEKIYERVILDVGKYEVRKDLRAERTPEVLGFLEAVTHSMRMRATVHVTMAINLESMQQEDIQIDEDTRTITITLPQAQPVECFLEDIEYYDESCIFEQCERLERDLRNKAFEEVLASDALEEQLDQAFFGAQDGIAELIAPFIEDDYQVEFLQSDERPDPIPGRTCDF